MLRVEDKLFRVEADRVKGGFICKICFRASYIFILSNILFTTNLFKAEEIKEKTNSLDLFICIYFTHF